MQKKWTDYQLILFDMDGTLYFQRPLQIHMGLKMLFSCITPGGFREMMTVLKFRKLREHWESSSLNNKADLTDVTLSDEALDKAQYQALAGQMSISAEEIEKAVQKWIYQMPLALLMRYRDHKLAEILKKYHLQTQVAIYSDYPATDKRDFLNLADVPCFYGGQKEICAMKPDPKGLRTIMEAYHIDNPSDVLMIGDRFSKDGQAAINAGCDYFILKKYKFQRGKQYRALLSE